MKKGQAMNRREFMKTSTGCAAYAALGMAFPGMFKKADAAKASGDILAMNETTQEVAAGNLDEAERRIDSMLAGDVDAWQIHLSLFAVVQRVLNPPYINPHLPKMYAIYRYFIPYLTPAEIAALVRIEISECTRRPKLKELPQNKKFKSPVSFKDCEAAIGDQDWEKTAVLMAAFHARQGGVQLARRLLLLGSGYLNRTLGHSISCTAFILSEMLQHPDRDPWPALAPLAYYFCRGRFYRTPVLQKSISPYSNETLHHHLLQASSGRGIVNLHHAITVYALEHVRRFFSRGEYVHLIGTWIEFMGEKDVRPVDLGSQEIEPADDYGRFYRLFSRLEPDPVVQSLAGLMASPQGRRQLSRFLIKGVCDLYQGNYDAHNLTGLGSALWFVEQFWNQPPVAVNALYQYLEFFFDDLKSKV
jgi:hypothetical protein